MDPVGAVKPKKKTEKQDVSLKTAESSKTSKTPSAAVQTGTIKIMGIKKSNKTNTHITNLETSECASTSGSVAEKQKPDADQQKSSEPDEPDGLTVYSIKEVKSFPDKTDVGVQGTVTKINPHVKKVKVKFSQKKRNKQEFQLKDETDSIEIVMWGDETKQCRGLSVDDVVKVTNMKTHHYTRPRSVKANRCHKTISLYSTVYTRIEKMDPVEKIGSRSVPKTRKRKPAAGTTSTLADSGLPKKQKSAAGPSKAIPAEEKLCTVRTKFVEGVSDANLNQLLDKLLERRVINDEEMQTINTKSVRADKARYLIDTVRRKGTKASSLFIDTLREVDPLLSENLK